MTSKALIGILFLLSFHVRSLDQRDIGENKLEDKIVYQTTLQDSQLEGFIGFCLFRNFDNELININFLSNILNNGTENENNTTLAPFNLYLMLMVLFKNGSEDIKEELRQFFPRPLSVVKAMDLSDRLMPKAPDKNSPTQLYSYLYLLAHDALKNLPESPQLAYSSDFIKQLTFKPNKESIAELNQLILEDHHGKLKGPLNDTNLANTLAFLVSTLYVDTPWHMTFSDSKLLFSTKEGVKLVPSFIGTEVIEYSQNEDFIIVHVPASEGIYLALKISSRESEHSVSPITVKELNTTLKTAKFELEVPNFHIENSLDIHQKMKELLPKTLDKNEENIYRLEIKQANELTVNKTGITISSVSKAVLTARGNTDQPRVLKLNKPFSYVVYKKIDNNLLPLVDGELRDPALDAQISLPNLNSIPAPEKSIDRSFFYLVKYLYENISNINEHQKCLCPLSSLIALNNIKNIYKGEKYIDEFLTGIHFDLKLNTKLIETLIHSKMCTIRIEQSLSIHDQQMESIVFLRALMELDDEMISSIKWFIEQFIPSLDDDFSEIISDFSLIHWDESDIICQISDEEWRTIQALKITDLREHLKGFENQSIREFSLKLLNRNDAKFLMFLKFFSSFKEHLKSAEEIKKIIKVSWFIMKNKQLIGNFLEEEIMGLFNLDKEKAQILSTNSMHNIPLYLGNIRSSLADAYSNPKLTYSRNPLNTQDIHFGLYISSALSPAHVEFEDSYTDGMSGIVKGFYQETAERRTIALPAFDDLFLILEDSYNNLPEYITFSEQGEQKEFFLSLPLFEKNLSGYSFTVPWKKGSTMEVKSKIAFKLCGIGPAKTANDNALYQEVRFKKPFRYTVARKMKNEDGTISYAILLTGIHDGSAIQTNESSESP